MDGLQAVNELNTLINRLNAEIKQYGNYGRDLAKKEAEYKTALMSESLKLRDSGMAVTLIDKVVFGKVAEARFNRDVAEVMYKTAGEKIMGTKLQIRILENQIEREWGGNHV